MLCQEMFSHLKDAAFLESKSFVISGQVICCYQQPPNALAQGLVALEGHEGETVTKGLEHLKQNCEQYYR